MNGDPRAFMEAHPTSAELVVEVADESLEHDRTVKQRLYAPSGIPEYWIVALPDRRIEVRRESGSDGYRSVRRHADDERVAPLRRPDDGITAAELLP